ncbi:MAG: flavodoxin family protein [Bacillota bacterium]
MKLLGIACSPRPQGNSAILLEEALKEASTLGWHTEIIYLRKLKFSICTGCEACSKTGLCVFKDELVELFARISAAEKVILAAPVFSMGINALAKGMIDRAQMYWARKYVLNQQNHGARNSGMFFSTAGMDMPGVHDCSVKAVKYFFKMLDIDYKEELLVTKVDAPGDVLKRPEVLTQAREKVRHFVQSS